MVCRELRANTARCLPSHPGQFPQPDKPRALNLPPPRRGAPLTGWRTCSARGKHNAWRQWRLPVRSTSNTLGRQSNRRIERHPRRRIVCPLSPTRSSAQRRQDEQSSRECQRSRASASRLDGPRPRGGSFARRAVTCSTASGRSPSWRTSSPIPYRSNSAAPEVSLARFGLRIVQAMQPSATRGKTAECVANQ